MVLQAFKIVRIGKKNHVTVFEQVLDFFEDIVA